MLCARTRTAYFPGLVGIAVVDTSHRIQAGALFPGPSLRESERKAVNALLTLSTFAEAEAVEFRIIGFPPFRSSGSSSFERETKVF